MKLRCPYCKKEFGPEPASHCPHCGKTMMVPRSVRQAVGAEQPGESAKAERRRRRRGQAPSVADRAAGILTFTRNPRYLAVLVILFIVLGAMLVTRTTQRREEALRQFLPEQRATHDLTTLRIALEMFRKDCGRYPSTRETLLPLLRPSKAPGWDGPYIRNLFDDPWRHPYRYSLSNGVVRLSSDGPDGKPATEDDMHAPVPNIEELFPSVAPEGLQPDAATSSNEQAQANT